MTYKLHTTKQWTDCACPICKCSISVKTGDKDAAERISDWKSKHRCQLSVKSKTKAVKVPLNIGRQNPLQYEITEGLQPGEFVIITGYDTFGDAEELILK